MGQDLLGHGQGSREIWDQTGQSNYLWAQCINVQADRTVRLFALEEGRERGRERTIKRQKRWEDGSGVRGNARTGHPLERVLEQHDAPDRSERQRKETMLAVGFSTYLFVIIP